MLSLLDTAGLLAGIPEGLDPAQDRGTVATGILTGVEPETTRAQVRIGSSVLWMPAMPGIYAAGGPVRVLLSPIDGGKAIACLGPVSPGEEIVDGVVTAVATGLLTVNALGSSYTLPMAPGTYAPNNLVYVVRSPQRLGLPTFVLGPTGGVAGSAGSQPGGGQSNPGTLVTRQIVILPQWSGSWRSGYSRWDTWNTDRYGGRSTLWQGNGYGSTNMIGLATYGDQIVNLGAVSILSIIATVTRADSSTSAGVAPVLQASPHGSQPGGGPSLIVGGTAAGPALTPGRTATVALPGDVLDGFRTGAYKGLATVGGGYGGFSGTARADGMALTIQYTVIQ